MPASLPLLLLPGLMNDERVWGPVRHVFLAGRTVVSAETHTADSVVELAAAALNLMPPGRFAVAGFSLGGYVALEVCRQAPDRIGGLALLDTGAQADSPEASQNRQRMVAALRAGAASFAQVASGFAARIIHPSHAEDVALLDLLGDMARNIGRAGFERQQTVAMNRPDSRQVLRQLRCPALVLCGREDQVTPPALSEEMASLLLHDVDLVIVPDCGHMATLEQTPAVADALGRWIHQVDAVAASPPG